MGNSMDGDLLNEVEKSLRKNVEDFQKQQGEKEKRSCAGKTKQAEEYFFALKVAQPAQVKHIFRLKPNSDLEEKTIADFIKYTHE